MVRFIHVSDPHFSAAPGVHSFITAIAARTYQAGVGYVSDTFNGRHCPEIAEIAADFIAREFSGHDCLLLTGDLATRGSYSDLRTAYDHTIISSANSSTYLTVDEKPTFCIGSRPIVLIPGNHDRFLNATGVPGGIVFDEIFAEKWAKGARSVQANKVTGNDGTTIHVICADFTLESSFDADPLPFFPGQGRCSKPIIDELVRVTKACRAKNPATGIIWVSHFPPTLEDAPVSRLLELIDGQMLIDAAIECEIKYIIGGHTHEAYTALTENIMLVVGGTTCTLNSKHGNSINSLEFSVNNGIAELHLSTKYVFDRGNKYFVRNN